MKEVQGRFILRGQTLAFSGNPFEVGAEDAVDYRQDGAVVVEGGRIIAVGAATEILKQNSGAPVTNYGDALLMAGFVDAHTHYPQVDIIGSSSQGLVDWLQKHTFPCESQFGDKEVAENAAEFFLDQCFLNGVTTASVYCTVHPQSVESFFEATTRRNACMVAGKVCMDSNTLAGLADTAKTAYDQSKALIERWHGEGRNRYAITPRFALTSSAAQLEALGSLWREHPTALMQTHLSETKDEIARVLQQHPTYDSYYQVYESFGLAGEGAIFGHGIHLSGEERRAIAESGAAIAHCPTSNAFMGSGIFDLEATRRAAPDILVSLASDVGAGVSFSMFATMRAAYEAARYHGVVLHPAEAFWMATCAGAKAMRLDDRLGNLAPGMDADLVVLDLKSNPLLARRVARAEDFFDVLFAQIIMADERAVKATYVAGTIVHQRALAST
ncbi:MAG: guanine deaminase [Alphaproteobacteria bacterium]|nr:guanine deaminase [Alphaproteobacteria bacterium]